MGFSRVYIEKFGLNESKAGLDVYLFLKFSLDVSNERYIKRAQIYLSMLALLAIHHTVEYSTIINSS